MALDSVIKKLLNDFADSQPALRYPGKPLGTSNIQLGDLLEDALSESASEASYAPTTAGDWTPAPTTVSGALDQLADRVKTLESDVATAQSTAEDAENQVYTAGTPGDWATAAPVTLKEAVDRIAAALAAETAAPIP